MSPDEPEPGTWAAVTRSTEAEFKAFRKGLDSLMMTQERLNHIISQAYLMVEWNIKPRLVRCPNCKKEVMTDIAGPKCDVCGYSMITVIKKD